MKMEPMTEASERAVVAGMEAISRSVYAQQSDLPPGYFTVARAGWLRPGCRQRGWAKILIRVQGPSPAPEDDEFVEAKQVQSLSGLPCLEAPPSDQPTLRVILGARQIGHLKPTILAASPELVIPEVLARGRQLRDWWIRSWDPSYRELGLSNLRSVQDLAEMAYDAGVQLGAHSAVDQAGIAGRFRSDARAGAPRPARTSNPGRNASAHRRAVGRMEGASSPMNAATYASRHERPVLHRARMRKRVLVAAFVAVAEAIVATAPPITEWNASASSPTCR